MRDADFFRRWLDAAAAAVEREADRLTELDSPIGDADHGSNLLRGFVAVRAALAGADASAPPGALLQLAGRTLISTVGGASGPLYGTLLRRTGKELGEAAEVSDAQVREALGAGVDAVARLGGAAPGDKTMLDALVPGSRPSPPPTPMPRTRPTAVRWRPPRCSRARAGPVTSGSAASGTRTRVPPRRRC